MRELYHIGLSKGDLPSRVLLPGSRKRVQYISEFIDGELIDKGRQLVAVGRYRGKEVAAVDTGMGPSSAAIVVREVIEAMDRKGILVRVGTCGSLQSHIDIGHLIISSGVVVDECVSRRIIGDLPLIPSSEVVESLTRAAEARGYERGRNLHVGLTHTKDALYEFEDPRLSNDPEYGRKRLKFLTQMGVLATDMELSVILALASWYNARGSEVKAGGILLVVSPYVRKGLKFERPSQRDLVLTALDALVQL